MRRLISTSLVLLAIVATAICAAPGLRAPASAADDAAAALLAKNRAFAGWAFGDASMEGLRATGHAGTLEITDIRRGVLWRRTTKNPASNLTYGTGFTGKLFWSTNENGFLVPIIGDGSKYDVSYSLVMNQGLPLLSGTAHGTASVDGVSAQIVRLETPNGFPLDAYFDPASGKLVRAVIDPDGSRSTIDILGYRAIDGKQVISKWSIGSSTAEFDSIVRADISNDDLIPPRPSARWEFGSAAPVPITVTDTRIIIQATINGTPGRFVLDSGAGIIALDADFAARAKIADFAAQTSLGASGSVQGGLARVDTIAVGQHVLHNVVVSTGTHLKTERENIDGLFGFDFLAGAIVDVDLIKQQMTLFDPAQNDVTATGPVVVADLRRGIPVIPATIDGSTKAHVLLDSGDTKMVILNESLSRKVTMRIEGYAQIAGTAGDSRNRIPCGHGQQLELGALKYGSFPLCFGDMSFLGADGGIVGFDFLKHFNMTFDYANARLYLTPNGK